MRNFEEIIVSYHSDDIIPYPEYKEKPYFSIQYEENGEHHIGYGTYNPQVLSSYIKDYFNSRASIVEELEEIKAEIEVIHNRYKINFQGYSMSVAKECMDILDKRIKEIEE